MKRIYIIVSLLVLSLLVVSCTQGETLAGEATKLTGTRAGELQRACPKGCGPVFLSANDIFTYYGNQDFRTEKDGNTICRDLGYSSCLFAERTNMDTFYASTDGSCTGDIQYTDQFIDTVSCAGILGGSICSTAQPPAGSAEPMDGDHESGSNIYQVVCLR